MADTKAKVCIFAGRVGVGEYSLLVKYAKQGCRIAFMDINREIGHKIKLELETLYHTTVFFFHGDVKSEEDRDIFFTTTEHMYGKADYIICQID